MKRETSAQLMVGAAESNQQQVASAGTPAQMMTLVATGQPLTATMTHAGLVLSPAASNSQQTLVVVRSPSGQVAMPAAQRPPQSTPQYAVTSQHLQSSSLGIPRQMVPAPARHNEALLAYSPRSSSSSHTAQVVSAAVQHQPYVSEPLTSRQTGSASSHLQRNRTDEHVSTSSGASPMSVNSTSAAALRQSRSLSQTVIADKSASVELSAVSQSDVASASIGTPHDMTFNKEQLLQLKEKVQKKGSVERDRQKVITDQLSQLQSEIPTDEETVIDDVETVVDDVEPNSPELTDISLSDSSISIAACSKSDENVRLHLHVSSSSSDSTFIATDMSNRCTGTFCCQVLDCSSIFRRACQLATHYTEYHTCDFSQPRDEHDLEIYNRCMSAYQPTTSGKRKRSSSTSRHAPTKRARTKSGSGRYECDDCGRRFARSGDLNRHYREAHFISTDDEEY